MKSPHTGLRRIWQAFLYSCAGVKAAFGSEEAFRQDVVLFLAGSLVAFFLPLPVLERGLLISALLLILLMELVNTAIETVVDRISADYHALSKKAKDIGSALVLLSFLNAGLIWAAVLCSHF